MNRVNYLTKKEIREIKIKYLTLIEIDIVL